MRNQLLSSTSLIWALAAAGIACSVPAYAEAPAKPAAANASDNSEVYETVVVTAQRRQERLQDVPLTVNVIQGEQIESKSMSTIRDILDHMPQVSFQQTGDQRTDTLSIRGISSVSNAPGVEPDVGIVIDGEALARTMQMNYDAVDIQRLEVLEGPQGTLFGKNAVAGLINIVTKGPTLDNTITGSIKLDVAEDDEYRLKSSVNIPLSATSALYVTGYGTYMGGWEKNVHPGQPNAGGESGAGVRAQYLYQPDSSFSIVLKGEFTRKTMGIIPYAFKELSEADVIKASQELSGGTAMVNQFNALWAASGVNLVTSTGISTPIVNGTQSYLYNDRTWGKMQNYAFSVNAKKEFENFTLHYIGTFRHFYLWSNDNEWGVSAPQLTNSKYGLNTLNYAGPSIETTVQQEVRLESKETGPFNYVVGAFYYYNDNYHQETNKTCNDAVYGYYNGSGYPDPNPIYAVDNFECTGGYVGHYTVSDSTTQTFTRNEALFGNAEYNIWRGLTAFAGVRVLWEQQGMSFQHGTDDTGAAYFYDSTDPFGKLVVHDSRSAITYRVGAKYDFGPVMAYASYSTGFKGVSWNTYAQASKTRASSPLPPEKPEQMEVGLRGDFLNHRVDVQLSAFHLVDHDFQARSIIRDPRFQLAVVNAKTAETNGIEFGANAWLMKGLKVGGGYTYLPDAHLMDDVLFPNGTNKYLNYKGARLPNAPRNAATAYIDYSFAFPSPDLTSELRFEYRYRGAQESVLTLDTLQVVQPYGIFDAYWTLTPDDSRWSMTLYAKNVFDHLYYQRAYEPAVMGWVTGQMAFLPRDYARYFGANLRYNFN